MNDMNKTWSAQWHALLRQRLLQLAFPLTMTWLLFLILLSETEGLLGLNPFTEREIQHQLFEDWVQPLTALGIFTGSLWLHHCLLRRWPGFLQLPPSAPLIITGVRILVHGAALFVAVTVGTVAISYLFYDPATDPQGQFHIWVWGGGFLYAAALAPTAALFTVWRASSRKRRRSE